jgi:ADP-ribose pyrophosphatase YjhB (NUDIX family)
MGDKIRAMYCSGCGHALPQLPPVTCNVCGTAHWRDAKPCASGLVTWRGRLLLVQRANEPWQGCWDTPGGFCGSDEHPILTAEREVLEETGLAVRITGLLGMWMDHYGSSDDEAKRKTTLNIYYHAVPLEADPHLKLDPTEVVRADWFEPDKLPTALAFPQHIVRVLRAWHSAFLAGEIVSSLPDRPTSAGG